MKNLKIVLQFNIIFIIISIILGIYVYIKTNVIEYESIYNIDTKIIEGKINSFSINGNKLSIQIGAKEDINASYYLDTFEEKEYYEDNLCIGCSIIVEGKINEVNNNTIPNTFNYKKYLYNNGMYYTFSIDKIKINKDNGILHKFKDYLYKKASENDIKGYLKIFVLGDKSSFSTEEYSIHQINGTAHLLAISGMHIGIIVSILNKILKYISIKKRTIIISLILLIFAFITNFGASILRAVLFYIVMNLKKIYKWRIHDIKVLLIVAYILIIIDPFVIYDIGFIYSFIITGGIILNKHLLNGNYFKQLLLLSIITFLYSLPITAYLNYEINLFSIVANMILVPFVSFIFYPITLIVYFLPFLIKVYEILIICLESISTFLEKMSIIINIPKISILLIVLYYLVLLRVFNNKFCIWFLILIIFIPKLVIYFDKSYYVYFFDIGQGDSALLISPQQKEVVMIDTGGKISYEQEEWKKGNKKYNLSDNTIKFLKSMGITKIDLLIISHGDYDHMGEAINLVNDFKIEKVIFNNNEYNDLELEFIDLLEKKNISYYKNIKGLNFDKSKLYFLNNKLYDNENDNSNIIYTKLNDTKLLLMGDAGVDVEAEMLKKFNLNDVDILKVGHHGSKTSTSKDFIYSIKPKYSIISVGKNNRYGHPNDEVLENLKNSKVYRTDRDGSIMFKIEDKLQINTYSP